MENLKSQSDKTRWQLTILACKGGYSGHLWFMSVQHPFPFDAKPSSREPSSSIDSVEAYDPAGAESSSGAGGYMADESNICPGNRY